VAEVLAGLTQRKAERDELANVEDALAPRSGEEEAARKRYRAAAGTLSSKRRAAAPRFSAAVQKELSGLALEKAGLRVVLDLVEDEARRESGSETAAFWFAPNPGEPEKPLEKTASGGELSRVQLAIRTVAAGKRNRGRTLVFDEVDAGIGGGVAGGVGRKLRDLAATEQVLCVTHVPQIAALAERHYLAEKKETRGRPIGARSPFRGTCMGA